MSTAPAGVENFGTIIHADGILANRISVQAELIGLVDQPTDDGVAQNLLVYDTNQFSTTSHWP